MRRWMIVLALAASARAQGATTEEMAKVAETIEPSSVVVEYWLRFDRGEAPRALSSRGDEETLVREERPLERGGFLAADGRVITTDPMIHPRFVERVRVRRGRSATGASPFSYLASGNGLVLKLDGPLEGARPLVFDAKAAPAFRARMHSREEAWGISVWRFSTVLAREDGRNVRARGHAARPGRRERRDGRRLPVLRRASARRLVEGARRSTSRRSPPSGWRRCSPRRPSGPRRGLPRVSLSLRSAKSKGGGGGRFAFFGREESGDDATELHATGVVLDGKRVLVLADLKPKVTARLEGVLVHVPGGDPVPADFRCSLKRLGAFVVEARSPLPAPLPLPTEEIRGWRGKPLVASEVVVSGEERNSYVYPARFDTLRRGWREEIDPAVDGDEENLFLFDASGTLLALPAVRRDLSAAQERWHQRDSASLLSAVNLKELLEDTDPANVPLSEEEENRLAWMGVVLQPLDAELAKANKVSELTKGGDVGGFVSFVYPGSPAARAGVEAGDILLRIHAEGVPKPLDVKVEENPFASFDMPEEVPEEMLDAMGDMPPPWPPAESELARMLTDLGVGRKYEAEFSRDGKIVRKPFVVEWGPTHYDSAKRFKSDPLGLTVRDLTYEVRQHYQLQPDEKGVVVSKVEKGKKAAVAGVHPFEIVTQVDEKPVASAEEFGKAVAAGGEHRFTLKYKSRTRVVKIAAGEAR